MTISVPQSVFDLYNEGVDYMIDSAFGINCKILYPALRIDCENCYNNTLPGVGFSNRYRAGGPYPFTEGVCPYCNSLGYKESETSEVIKVRAYFDTVSWKKFNPNIAFVDGNAVIIGYLVDLPKFQNMAGILLANDINSYNPWKYGLSKEPIPWGFKRNRYFTTNVSRSD